MRSRRACGWRGRTRGAGADSGKRRADQRLLTIGAVIGRGSANSTAPCPSYSQGWSREPSTGGLSDDRAVARAVLAVVASSTARDAARTALKVRRGVRLARELQSVVAVGQLACQPLQARPVLNGWWIVEEA